MSTFNESQADPFSMAAEQAVLGALLQDNDAVDRVSDLRQEHFYRGDHRSIYVEISKQILAGKSCDVISVADALSSKIDDCASYLNDLVQNTPSAANIARYAGIVREKALKRGLMAIGHEVADAAAVSAEPATQLIDQFSSKLEALAEARDGKEPVRASERMIEYVEELERRRGGDTGRVIPTGFADVDKKLSGGLRRGGFYIIAARPKMGKTALAMNILLNVTREHSGLLCSMEMPEQDLHDRNTAVLGRVPLSHLLQPDLMTNEDWGGLTAAIQKLQERNLFLDDQGALRLIDVRMKSKFVKRRHGLDVLFVDYLQLMVGDGDNRNSQIETISRGLKALAKELDIAVVALSQLSRKLEDRPNKRPVPSDIRDSGAIEQDADVVMLLYRDEVYNPDSPDRGVCEVNIPLIRQGAPGTVGLTYIGEQTRFEDMHWTGPPPPLETRRKGIAKSLV